MLEEFWWGDLKERDRFEKLGVVGRIKSRRYEIKSSDVI